MYDTSFCSGTAKHKWTLRDMQWNNETCNIQTGKEASWATAWMGEKDPLTLEWEDYRCSTHLSFKKEFANGSRLMSIYASGRTDSLDLFNAYQCGLVR